METGLWSSFLLTKRLDRKTIQRWGSNSSSRQERLWGLVREMHKARWNTYKHESNLPPSKGGRKIWLWPRLDVKVGHRRPQYNTVMCPESRWKIQRHECWPVRVLQTKEPYQDISRVGEEVGDKDEDAKNEDRDPFFQELYPMFPWPLSFSRRTIRHCEVQESVSSAGPKSK